VPFAIDWTRVGRLVALGAPAASQITLRSGVPFALATALAARLELSRRPSQSDRAQHRERRFMVPLGLASAMRRHVSGHAIGARDIHRARRAGWNRARRRRAAVMTMLGLRTVYDPDSAVERVHARHAVLAIGSQLLAIAAVLSIVRWNAGRRDGRAAAASATRGRR